MRNRTVRVWGIQGSALFALFLFGSIVRAQSVNVGVQTPFSPNPVFVGNQSTAYVGAASTAPSPPYPCTLTGGASWSWSVSGPAGVTIDGNGSSATISATIKTPGDYNITATATASWTDSCGGQYSASGSVTLPLAVVNVAVSPNPLIMPSGTTATVTLTTTPSGYETSFTLKSADPSVAAVSGSSPSYMVTAFNVGNTSLNCYFQNWQCPVTCPVYVFLADLQMAGVGAGQKLDPGGYVPLNANNDNKSVITNGVPAVRDKDTSPIEKEQDLVQVTMAIKSGLPPDWPVAYTLSAAQNGHGRITAWNTMSKQVPFGTSFTLQGTASAWPICYIEGIAEGYAVKEITLTLKVFPQNATGPSLDNVNVTVTPVLTNLSASITTQNQPGNCQKDSKGNWGIKSNSGNGPNTCMFVTSAINNGIGGSLQLIQDASNQNNLQNGKGASLGNNMFKTFDFDPKNIKNPGDPLVDCWKNPIPYYGTPIWKSVMGNGPGGTTITVTDYDTPGLSFANLWNVNAPPITIDVTQKFQLYAVWAYSDGTFYPLANTTWSVRYAGVITSIGVGGFFPGFTANKGNGNTGSPSFSDSMRSNALPPALGPMTANNGGAAWR